MNLFNHTGDHLQNMGQGTVGAALVMNINSVALNFSGIYHTYKQTFLMDTDTIFFVEFMEPKIQNIFSAFDGYHLLFFF